MGYLAGLGTPGPVSWIHLQEYALHVKKGGTMNTDPDTHGEYDSPVGTIAEEGTE